MERPELDELKARVDLVEVIRQSGVALKKAGKSYKGLCPFHDEDSPSLSVTPAVGLWRCFGCEAGGDVFRFLQLKEELTFPQALARVQELAGKVPANGTNGRAKANGKVLPGQEVLPGDFTRAGLLGRIAERYAQRLAESPAALEYFERRGLGSREVREAFRLGFADGSLLETVPGEGPLREALTVLGVLTASGRELLDGCLVVPLEHPDHGVVGLYGRKLDPRAKVRHLYLPGPRRGVFHWQALQRSREVWLTEGVLDAMALWAAGQRDVTCLYGTQAVPEGLQELLGRFAVGQVVFCLDGDAAGREATLRLGAALTARGLACRAVDLPEGADPNQVLVDQGSSALLAALASPRPLVPPEPETPAEGPETTADGFALVLGEVHYRLTLCPPFAERMKVVLRATRGERTFTDTPDLFSHRSRSATVVQMARQLELGKEEAEDQLRALLEHCERWAAETAGRGQDPQAVEAVPEMTREEREAALDWLHRPDLTRCILADMEAMGYVGEEQGKLLAYLVGISRKLDKPLSGIVRSESGAGKSGLIEVVELLCPPEDIMVVTRLSAKALDFYPENYFVHKLIIIEERVGSEAADYPIRVLQSKGRLVSGVTVTDPLTGQPRVRHFEVYGPVAYLETTTTAELNLENATRCFEIYLDESVEQTRRIHARQRQARTLEGTQAQLATQAIRTRHHQAQRLLEPVKVVIPFVHQLQFPARWLRTRRDHDRFLSLIQAVAFLHQHQRPRGTMDGPEGPVPYIQATCADYRLAYGLARDVLRTTLHELSRPARELWETLGAWARSADTQVFSRRQARDLTGWPQRRLLGALDELVEMEYLGTPKGKQGQGYEYSLLAGATDAPSIVGEMTTPDELEQLERREL